MSFYLTQSLHRAVRRHPEHWATVCGERRQTYRAWAERVARLGAALQSLGLQLGEPVAVVALNSDRFLECLLGILWAGGVVCPLNTRWHANEIATALADAQPRALITDDTLLDTVQAAVAGGGPAALIHAGDRPAPAGMHAYEDLLSAAEPIADTHRSGDDLALLLYTGGTTGAPKGVMLSHANMASASLGMAAMGCATADMHLHAVPLFHMAGIQMFFNHMLGGGTHVVLPVFDPLAALQLASCEAVGSLMLVPAMLQMMVEHPAAGEFDLSRLKRVFYGASPISEAILERAMATLPQAEFMQGYGMTETGITLMLPGFYHTTEGRQLGKLRSAGLPAPATEVCVVDECGQEAPRGAPGELLARGPMIMQGYWGQPERSGEALSDGWMHTGDVGLMDEDGFVFIVDRLKDMIVTGGENVYSTEVENALARHSAVRQCAVIGVPDERWGERVHAVIVLADNASEEELITYCKGLIAGYKCPRSIEFRDALPMSAAGKLLKNKLRESFRKHGS